MFASRAVGWIVGVIGPIVLAAVVFIIRLEGKVNALKEKDASQGEEIKTLREKVYEPLIRLVERFDQLDKRIGERFDSLDDRMNSIQKTPPRRRANS